MIDDLNRYAYETGRKNGIRRQWLEILGDQIEFSIQLDELEGGIPDYILNKLRTFLESHKSLLKPCLDTGNKICIDIDQHQFPKDAEVKDIIDLEADELERAQIDEGRSDPPAMSQDDADFLEGQIAVSKRLSEQIVLSPDGPARAAMERERRKALVLIGVTIARYYHDTAKWADQVGPKLAARATGLVASAVSILRSIGIF